MGCSASTLMQPNHEEKKHAFSDENIIAGRFELVGSKGRNCWGRSFEAFDRISKQRVLLQEQSVKRSFENKHGEKYHEYICLLKELDSPYILKTLMFFTSNEHCYLVQEMVSGWNLTGIQYRIEIFSSYQTKVILAQIILALEHLHSKNILYNNLHPRHIWLDRSGRCVLKDLENCCRGPLRGLTVFPISGYVAPEAIAGYQYDYESDYYSLGVLGYWMLRGKTVFEDHPSRKTWNRKKRNYRDKSFQEYATLERSPRFDPRYFSPRAKDFFRCVLRKDPRTRLTSRGPIIAAHGVKESLYMTLEGDLCIDLVIEFLGLEYDVIRLHPWFEEINFEDIEAGDLPSFALDLFNNIEVNETQYTSIRRDPRNQARYQDVEVEDSIYKVLRDLKFDRITAPQDTNFL